MARGHTGRRVALAAATMSVVMCAGPEDGAPEAPLHAVHYTLDWDWGEATPTATGWEVFTDRGYQVEVTRGFLVTYSVQLAPCTEDEVVREAGLFDRLGVGRAWAGHGDVLDPSAWAVGIAEDLAQPTAISLDPVSVQGGVYCRGHVLMAHAEEGMSGLPDTMKLLGISLFIEGTATRDDTTAFSVLSSLPAGNLVAWEDPVRPIDLADGDVEITITRDLGRLLDGVEFSTMSDESIAKVVLLGLAERVTVDAL